MATLDFLKKLVAKNIGELPRVSVGFLAGATYPDGTSVPMVAAINEFGAPSRGQPPRPFFRQMVAKNKASWGDAVARNYKATGGDIDKTLARMGMEIKGQLQQSIRDLVDPPLAASTILRKGGGTAAKLAKSRARAQKLGIAGPDKPLIDTGHMLSSVDYIVEK